MMTNDFEKFCVRPKEVVYHAIRYESGKNCEFMAEFFDGTVDEHDECWAGDPYFLKQLDVWLQPGEYVVWDDSGQIVEVVKDFEQLTAKYNLAKEK